MKRPFSTYCSTYPLAFAIFKYEIYLLYLVPLTFLYDYFLKRSICYRNKMYRMRQPTFLYFFFKHTYESKDQHHG